MLAEAAVEEDHRPGDKGKGGSHGDPHYQQPASDEAMTGCISVARNCLMRSGNVWEDG